jgi:hypothetical protein
VLSPLVLISLRHHVLGRGLLAARVGRCLRYFSRRHSWFLIVIRAEIADVHFRGGVGTVSPGGGTYFNRWRADASAARSSGTATVAVAHTTARSVAQ